MVLSFAKSIVKAFFADDALSLAAAVAFCTAFSFAPLVLLLVTVGGFLGDGAQNELIGLFEQQLGPRAGEVTRAVVDAAQEDADQGDKGLIRWVVGIGGLLVSASAAFAQLQSALNRVWGVVPRPTKGIRGWWTWLRKRLLSMGLVFTVLFILLASLVISTTIEWMFPRAAESEQIAGRAVVFVVSFVVAILVFAAMFKVLPDVVIPWRDLWFGALVTAALFTGGKAVLSIYLAKGGVGENYGSAGGGLIVLLVWVYYSSAIVLLGAEFTKHRARNKGSSVRPRPYAQWSAGVSERAIGQEPRSRPMR